MISDDLKFKVGLSLVVLVGAGVALWYTGKKISGVAKDAKGAVMDVVNEVSDTITQVFVPSEDSQAKEVINAPVHFIDGIINSAGQFVTGNPSWNQASVLHKFEENFGIKSPTSWE